MIIVKDVYKRYTTRNGVSDWVLKGINLVIPKNRSVGIVGGVVREKRNSILVISEVMFASVNGIPISIDGINVNHPVTSHLLNSRSSCRLVGLDCT